MVIAKNPILSGFYPDPSICRVGNDFYIVNSSFVYAPGVPIFHSRDLAHWEQIGNILESKEQLQVEKSEISRGIFGQGACWGFAARWIQAVVSGRLRAGHARPLQGGAKKKAGAGINFRRVSLSRNLYTSVTCFPLM